MCVDGEYTSIKKKTNGHMLLFTTIISGVRLSTIFKLVHQWHFVFQEHTGYCCAVSGSLQVN